MFFSGALVIIMIIIKWSEVKIFGEMCVCVIIDL